MGEGWGEGEDRDKLKHYDPSVHDDEEAIMTCRLHRQGVIVLFSSVKRYRWVIPMNLTGWYAEDTRAE
jgi:hypothetical protein